MSSLIPQQVIPSSAYITADSGSLIPDGLSLKASSFETSRIDKGKKIKVLTENYKVPRNTTYFFTGQLTFLFKNMQELNEKSLQTFIESNILLYRDNNKILEHSVNILNIKKCAENNHIEYVVDFVASAFFDKKLVSMRASYELKMFEYFGVDSIKIIPTEFNHSKSEKKSSSSSSSSTDGATKSNSPPTLHRQPMEDLLRVYIEQVDLNKELQRKNNELEASLKEKAAVEQQLLQGFQAQNAKIQELETQGTVLSSLLYVKMISEQQLHQQIAELVTQVQESQTKLQGQMANNERLNNELNELAKFNAIQTKQLEGRKRTREK